MGSQNIWLEVLFYILYKYYNLKLGKEEDVPEFSDCTYFAMLFSCGARPHGDLLPLGGVHCWIPYVTIGALISILTYRRGFPMSMRFTLYPLIGEMCYGVVGDVVEVLSVLCTIFGVCTSLGLGAMQINKGIVRLDSGTYRGIDSIGCENPGDIKCKGRMEIEINTYTQIVIIVVITLLATGSVVMGLKKGIAAISQIAFALSLFILLTVLFMDETWYILNSLTSSPRAASE
jgi:choline-glycine betaine transporter